MHSTKMDKEKCLDIDFFSRALAPSTIPQGQRKISGVLPYHSPSYSLEIGSRMEARDPQ